MKHVFKSEWVSEGYCDAPYCNIDHGYEKAVCSCGYERKLSYSEDVEKAELRHRVEVLEQDVAK